MTQYIKAVGAAVIIAALTDMLAPEGSFKKYCRLICGFVVLATVLSPVTSKSTLFPAENFYADTDAARRKIRAEVLVRHRENLALLIENRFPPAKAYVEVDDEGNVTKVSVENAADEAAVKEYVTQNFAIGEENVKINENKGASDE